MASEKTINPMEDAAVMRFCPNCGGEVLKTWEDLTEDERFIAVRRGFQPDAEPSPEERFCARCLTHIEDDAPQNV